MLKSVGDDGRFPATGYPLDEGYDVPSILLVDVEREPSAHDVHPLTRALVQLLVFEDGVELRGRYVAPIHGLVFRVVLEVKVLRGHEPFGDKREFLAVVRDESTVVEAPEEDDKSTASNSLGLTGGDRVIQQVLVLAVDLGGASDANQRRLQSNSIGGVQPTQNR